MSPFAGAQPARERWQILMKRSELEHVIRASADIANDDEIVIVGSQAILGQFPDAPTDLLVSVEADIYPKNHPP